MLAGFFRLEPTLLPRCRGERFIAELLRAGTAALMDEDFEPQIIEMAPTANAQTIAGISFRILALHRYAPQFQTKMVGLTAELPEAQETQHYHDNYHYAHDVDNVVQCTSPRRSDCNSLPSGNYDAYAKLNSSAA